MAARTVPISEASHRTLDELTQQTGRPVQDILDRAIEDYRRKVFLDAVNAGYAALRADPQAWADEQAERAAWDATLMDGLDPDERWTDDGRAVTPEEGER